MSSTGEQDTTLQAWAKDFTEAKLTINRLISLIKELFNGQKKSTLMLSTLFGHYANTITETPQENAQYLRYFTELEKYAQELDTLSDERITKCREQLTAVKHEISTWVKTLEKTRKINTDSKEQEIQNIESKITSFLSIFDAFITRFTLKLKNIQAEHSKRLMDIFNIEFSLSANDDTRKEWFTKFETVMLAVESMKHINAHMDQHMENKDLETHYSETIKHIHDKFTKKYRAPEFSNRMGFFHEYAMPPPNSTGTHPIKEQYKNDESAISEYVIAIYDFTSSEDSELTFNPGDRIKVVDKGTDDDPNWWCGELNGKVGLFPKNYVRHEVVDEIDEYIPSTANSSAIDMNTNNSSQDKQQPDSAVAGNNIDELL